MKHEIRYGKAEITVYRSYATPLRGIAEIPESDFTGRSNTLFAAIVTVEVFGDNFLPSYTQGDNSNVVATDTMKNFVYAMALEYAGATLEGFAAFLAGRFLEMYEQMQSVAIHCREIPFQDHSDKLLGRRRDDYATTDLEVGRSHPLRLESGRRDLRLIKLTGSAFAAFVRDDYTTLPERRDRPLHIYLDVFWTYADPATAVTGQAAGYVPSEQVRGVVVRTFDDFVSMSIQHLVHEMGNRLLDRFPQLASVRFEAQNRLWDTSAEASEGPARVFSDPKPAHGSIGLTLHRDDSA